METSVLITLIIVGGVVLVLLLAGLGSILEKRREQQLEQTRLELERIKLEHSGRSWFEQLLGPGANQLNDEKTTTEKDTE